MNKGRSKGNKDKKNIKSSRRFSSIRRMNRSKTSKKVFISRESKSKDLNIGSSVRMSLIKNADRILPRMSMIG